MNFQLSFLEYLYVFFQFFYYLEVKNIERGLLFMVEGSKMGMVESQRSGDFRVCDERVKWLILGCDGIGKIEVSREVREGREYRSFSNLESWWG